MVKYKGFTISKVAKRDRMYDKGYKYRATKNSKYKMYGRTMIEIKYLVTKAYTEIEKQKKKIEQLRSDIKRKREGIR